MSLRILLWAIGTLLAIGSRVSERVRAQLARDMTFVAAAPGGVARSYVIEGRRVSSRPGVSKDALCTLRFRTAAAGTRILLAPDAVGRIVSGLGTGEVECDGEAAVVLWFYELLMGLNPFRGKPRDAWPGSCVAPDPTLKASDRIVRAPPVDQLDPDWHDAHEQREKLLIWQVGRGAPVAGKFTRHRMVVDPTPAADERPR